MLTDHILLLPAPCLLLLFSRYKDHKMSLPLNTEELAPSFLFGSLPILKITFSVHIARRPSLPYYLGSAWRGLIGWELRRLICPFQELPSCQPCLIKDPCPYFMLFEKGTGHQGIKDAPRGYILYPPPKNNNSQEELEITLIGECTKLLPVIVAAIEEGQSVGLGATRSTYTIRGLWEKLPGGRQQALSNNSAAIIDVIGPFPLKEWISKAPQTVDPQVFFLTPIRLRKQGKYLEKMDWPFFFTTIACRLEALNCLFHTGEPLGRETFMKLQTRFELADQTSAALQWADYARFSNKQQRKVMMGGLIGTACRCTPSDGLEPWWQAVSLLHAGKGASMGLGRVEMVTKRVEIDNL